MAVPVNFPPKPFRERVGFACGTFLHQVVLSIFRELEQNIAVPQNKCLDEAMKFDLHNTDENIP